MTFATNQNFPPAAISVNEFCRAVGIGRSSFYEQKAAGRIKTIQMGRRTLVPYSEISAFLKRLEELPNVPRTVPKRSRGPRKRS